MATNSGNELTQMLRPLVQLLIDDMRSHLNATPEEKASWRAQFDAAKKAERVGVAYDDWETEQLTQAAVGWVVATVFIRFIEDNELFGEGRAYLSGYNTPLREAARYFERELYRRHPELSYRGYIEECVNQLSTAEATRGLVDEHAAIHIYTPTDDGARAIVEFWRGFNPDEEDPRALNDPDLDTRFLGDLYEHLSEFAQKKYALRQTPEFVEEFILDRTLTPALNDRPLEGFKLIDPTCGSGHFLIGAFRRIFERWRRQEPAGDLRVHVDRAMGSIYGVDINPYAVAITTFRLTVEAHKTGQYSHLKEPRNTTFTVLTGDTLLYGDVGDGQQTVAEQRAEGDKFAHTTEDASQLEEVLSYFQYDAVVGNPPYITVKDPVLNTEYRRSYAPYCKHKYALTMPFMVKFFGLARRGTESRAPGWVGQITSNSFMQRLFGVPVVEQFLRHVTLKEVVDTSGAYIPGHGTPTVILVGRNQPPMNTHVRAVLSIEGEPGVPKAPERGMVWHSITRAIDNPGFENRYISVVDIESSFFLSHPWSLQGGAAPELSSLIDKASRRPGQKNRLMEERISDIGFAAITGEDDAFVYPSTTFDRQLRGLPSRRFVEGASIRDFQNTSALRVVYPYIKNQAALPVPENGDLVKAVWPSRTRLVNGLVFGETKAARGLKPYEYTLPNHPRLDASLLIVFAFVATHNHFILDRGGKVFNRSAPVIKLPTGSTEDDHFELLGTLNSSTAAFWLKQNSHNKGEGGGARVDAGYAAMGSEAWKNSYEFAAGTLLRFPLPPGSVTERANLLDKLASKLEQWEPSNLLNDSLPNRKLVEEASNEYNRIRCRMIAEQEELDWAVYKLYGITEEDLSFPAGSVEGIELGQRAFEIALARGVAAGETETAWFERHRSTPVTELPEGWSSEYAARVQKRLELIESDRFINLLERPEYKRRWASEPWDEKVNAALRNWLLTRLEDGGIWFDQEGMPQPRSIAEISGVIEARAEYADVLSVLPLWSQKRDASTLQMLEDLLKGESVPYLKALRYKPSGLRKRAEWERTWEQQREEDAGTRDGKDVDVPPNYTSADMYPEVWKHRGKLDVPKERFIAYPGAGSEEDPTDVIGWAGWDHLQQGLAIYRLFLERKQEEAPVEVQAALLNGLQQELPWIMQWHNDVDPGTGERLGSYLSQHLEEHTHQLGISLEDLEQHNPARGRAKRAKGKSKK